MRRLRVQFVHGLEGSPQGSKARLLGRHFEARTPVMDTGDFEGCVELQARELAAFSPHVLVGSSFGAAVVVELLARGSWRGPTLLLAQAALRYRPQASLPPAALVWLVHGLRDELIDPEESRRLAATGDPDRVRLLLVDDDHRLHGLVESGELVRIVEQLAADADVPCRL